MATVTQPKSPSLITAFPQKTVEEWINQDVNDLSSRRLRNNLELFWYIVSVSEKHKWEIIIGKQGSIIKTNGDSTLEINNVLEQHQAFHEDYEFKLWIISPSKPQDKIFISIGWYSGTVKYKSKRFLP